ncbi:MAG: hypothetical protein IKX42_08885 [Fibrobacter sp.]|nr:hypothetical protein [Fibrobacter sp.]
MKRYLAFPALIAVFSLISACSSSTDLAAADNSDDGTSVASSGSTKSADSKTPTSSGDSVVVLDSTKINKVVDSTKIYISANSNVENPYYSSAIAFCWDEGCEANLPSSSSKAKSSSSSGGGASIDTPTIEGTTMTDNRNKKTYPLVTVGGKLWMAKDLDYAFGQSMCFNSEDAKCEKYGRLYTYNAAQSACPKGWKLPSREEAQALINDASYPWSYSGRCKTGECNFTEEMGFHWTAATAQEGDKKYGENSGDKFAVIIVEKHPDYDKEDSTRRFFQVDEKEKYFSVRCVQE